MKKFGANKIITEKIRETELATYAVGFDLNNEGEMEYRIGKLIKLLSKVIPEFAFGYHLGESIPIEEMVTMIGEAANAIYKINDFEQVKKIYLQNNSFLDDNIENKFLRRGEFGELILHLIMREFHETIPLLSKIYFKDSDGHTVHGFDAIHIQPDTKTVWLGESKLYMCGENGIDALLKDLEEHIERDYLNREFALISKKMKILDNIEEKDYWLDLFDEGTTLKEKFNSITIPMVCTYTSDLYKKYGDDSLNGFINDYISEVRLLKKRFDDRNKHKLKKHLNIILLLFPVKCKNELVKGIHKKLHLMQELSKDD